jgi:hypothetical protein
MNFPKAKKKEEKNIQHEGIATCTEAPMSRSGLEGYVLDEDYKYEVIRYSKAVWVRIYPDVNEPEYFETASSATFNNYFKVKS